MKFRVLTLTLTVLLLILCTGCQKESPTESTPYLTPSDVAGESTKTFAVSVPQGKTLSLYVECWQDGERISQDQLLTCPEGDDSVTFQVTPQEGRLTYTAQTASAAPTVETENPSACVYAWLTKTDWEQLTAQGFPEEVLLYALGSGDAAEGIPNIDCLSPLVNERFFERYPEAQAIRAVLEDNDT